jgi:HD-GYP domain-containing protein (c-di-GMP phosphodiesterase class II)
MTISSQSLLRDSECLDIALNVRDTHTGMHCSRVEGICMEMGRRFKLSKRELELLRVAARLHDVGKIGIADHILLKPGRFEPDEWEVMQAHAVMGEEICVTLPHPDAGEVARIVRHHHEGFSGQGYPDKLAGEAIPFSSRIISVVDAYDAMTTTRPYHPSRDHDTVMTIMASERGIKTDPYIFDRFAALIADSPHRSL